MYLIETGFTSQSVMSDTHRYKSVPGLNRTEGTYEEALAIRIIPNHVRIPHHNGCSNLYIGAIRCRDIRQVILSFLKVSGLHHRSSNAIHNVVSLFGMGYMAHGPLPPKPNNERNI